MKKITIIGPYPPPYGGISVHIKRMKEYLLKSKVNFIIFSENKIDCENNNLKYNKGYKHFIFKIPFLNSDIIHFHTSSYEVMSLFFLFKMFKKKIILTFHVNKVFFLKDCSNFYKKFLIYNYKKVDRIICVNSHVMDELVNYGVDKSKISIIPAYVNPIEDENDFKRIPQDVWNFINNSKFLISANGWIRLYNKEDLYGIDMLIELVSKLKGNGYEINLFIALLGSELQDEEMKVYYGELKNKIKSYDISRNIFILEVKDTEFYPILKNSKLLIRPTNTDGDAVSIREALYYKIPVIASDVVNRPEGTILFKTRNIDDLYNKTVDVIEKYDLYNERLEKLTVEENAEKLLNIYKELMN